mgnify:CR=1 FL=1
MFRNLFGVRLPRLALHTLLLALPFAAILAEPALAQNLDPLENMLQVVVDGLTGPIGRLIAILAVIVAEIVHGFDLAVHIQLVRVLIINFRCLRRC